MLAAAQALAPANEALQAAVEAMEAMQAYWQGLL
jgi:hypothetical protein